MTGKPVFSELEEYLIGHFPPSDLRTARPIIGEIHLRYELGDPYENGTDQRIRQVNERVRAIIEACYQPKDPVLMIINDWGGDDPMFGNTTPHHLYDVLDKSVFSARHERAIRTLTYEEIDSGRESHEEEHPVFRQICLSCPFESSSYQEVLSGIANYEQGREPAIGQQVVFLSMEKDLLFQMYDDRGCLVYSDSPDKIRYLYEDFSEWLVEGWRERFDAMFSR